MLVYRKTLPGRASFPSLVGQPKLQKWVKDQVGASGMLGNSATNLVASAVVSPIYVAVTNPLSRLEVIMQTNSIKGFILSYPPYSAAVESGERKFHSLYGSVLHPTLQETASL